MTTVFATYMPTYETCLLLDTFDHANKELMVIEFEGADSNDLIVAVSSDVKVTPYTFLTGAYWSNVSLDLNSKFKVNELDTEYSVIGFSSARSGEQLYIGYNSDCDSYVAVRSEDVTVVKS